MKVPSYGNQLAQPQSAPVPVQKLYQPNPEAFGVGNGAAISKVGDAISEVERRIGKAIEDMQARDRKRRTIKLDTDVGTEFQNAMYNEELDDNGRPKGFLSRQGELATGATPEFDEWYGGIKTKYLEQTQDREERAALEQLLDNRYEQSRSSVIKHEATEHRSAFTETLKSNLEQRIDGAAGITDPALLSQAIDDARTIQMEAYDRMGKNEQTIAADGDNLAEAMVSKAFEPVLAKDYASARVLFDGIKDHLPENARVKFEAQLEGRAIDDQKKTVYGMVQSFKLADKSPDLEKMQKAIFDMKIDTKKKETFWDYTKARAMEDDSMRKKEEAATTHSFLNQVLKMKSEGKVLDDALMLATQQGGDLAMQHERAEIAKKLYTSGVTTDVNTFVALKRGVIEGMTTDQDVGAAFRNNRLSGDDYKDLMLAITSKEKKFDDQKMKYILDRVAENSKKLPKRERENYEYTVLRSIGNKSPEEVLKLSEDLLGKDPSSGRIIQDRVYETDLKKRTASDLDRAQLEGDLGRGVPQLLGGDRLKIRDFANQFGGYEKIKVGTPVNQAIQAIIIENRRKGTNYPIHPDNVRAAMKQMGIKE